jgi:hypothetical protein
VLASELSVVREFTHLKSRSSKDIIDNLLRPITDNPIAFAREAKEILINTFQSPGGLLQASV